MKILIADRHLDSKEPEESIGIRLYETLVNHGHDVSFYNPEEHPEILNELGKYDVIFMHCFDEGKNIYHESEKRPDLRIIVYASELKEDDTPNKNGWNASGLSDNANFFERFMAKRKALRLAKGQ
jgi:hypothetical protein